MKNLLLAIFVFSGLASQAQLKIAHVDKQGILNVMPGRDSLDKVLEAYGNKLNSSVQKMSNDLNKMVAEIESQYDTLAKPIQEMRVQEINDFKVRLEKLQYDVQQDYAKKEKEVYQPIIDKLNAAIKAVALEKGYAYVLDKQLTYYADSSFDITLDVKKKLGITQ